MSLKSSALLFAGMKGRRIFAVRKIQDVDNMNEKHTFAGE